MEAAARVGCALAGSSSLQQRTPPQAALVNIEIDLSQIFAHLKSWDGTLLAGFTSGTGKVSGSVLAQLSATPLQPSHFISAAYQLPLRCISHVAPLHLRCTSHASLSRSTPSTRVLF